MIIAEKIIKRLKLINQWQLVTALSLLITACSKTVEDSYISKLIGGQHMTCNRLFDQENNLVDKLPTPEGFVVSPQAAIGILVEKANYNCHHKLGTFIYADSQNYYFARLHGKPELNIQTHFILIDSVVDGRNGSAWKILNYPSHKFINKK